MKPTSPQSATADREFVLTHTFRAPAAKVFAAYVDPRLVPKWWAPKGGTLKVDVMDVRPGGKWRYIQSMPHQPDMAFSGTYLDVQPVRRLVYTFQTEGQPMGPITATVALEEREGTTILTLTNLCATAAERDAMVKYGAAAGAKTAWERLAQLLAS